MSIHKTLADITTFGIGAGVTQPGDTLTSHVHNFLLTAMPTVSQPVIDDAVRAIFGLLLAVLSRYVYSWIDRVFKKKKEVAPIVESTDLKDLNFDEKPKGGENE